MYIMLNKTYGFGTVLLLMLSGAALSDPESPLLLKSRDLTAEYATQLKAALQHSMAAGGPVEAITVCSELAPRYAAEISRESGAKVRRTSLRFRNPGNAPDDWEAHALMQLAETGDAEFFAITPDGGARYLKAIPTGPVCVTCHGHALPPAVQDRLDEAYPHDRATGFAVGDLRGAFSVSWPAERAATESSP
jgi:hypothetical protein